MIKSMTGYGRHETVTDDYKILIEIKSVNHRYCDLNIKLPKKFNAYENELRVILKGYAARGKIDAYISYEDYSEKNVEVRYHDNIAGGYMEAIEKAEELYSTKFPGASLKYPAATDFLKLPEVISLETKEVEDESLQNDLKETFEEACKMFRESREREGEHLKTDILSKLDYILKLVKKIEERSPEILAEYRQKIMTKVEELLGDKQIDDTILATELTVFADKVCVDEETVRLHSHIKNMRDTLSKDESIGRKLDFLVQEINREANTILSKANDMKLSADAIDLKTEIEKIREQIQNIE